MYGYRDLLDGVEHVALVHGELGDGAHVLVGVHSECLTGDVVGSLRCDCGRQLAAAMDRVAAQRRGVVLYLREPTGRVYQREDRGSWVAAVPQPQRDYTAAAQILADLGVRSLRLMSGDPAERAALRGHGLRVPAVGRGGRGVTGPAAAGPLRPTGTEGP